MRNNGKNQGYDHQSVRATLESMMRGAIENPQLEAQEIVGIYLSRLDVREGKTKTFQQVQSEVELERQAQVREIEARLDEAKWWHDNSNGCGWGAGSIECNTVIDEGCQRIAALAKKQNA